MIPAGELILLDTNVILHIVRNDSIGQRILAEQSLANRGERPLVSIVSIGEILVLGKRRNWGNDKTSRLQQLLGNLVVVDIKGNQITERYADITVHCENNGLKLSDNDLWIAATAGLTGSWLLTCDKDFDPLDPLYLKHVYVDPHA